MRITVNQLETYRHLKKISRDNGDLYTYISRQALRYNMIEQLAEETAPVQAEGSGDKKVIQFDANARIDKYPEIDFFWIYENRKRNRWSET